MHQDFILHTIPLYIVNYDISIFLKYNLGDIRQERRLAEDWPGEAAIKCLTDKASGLFIWAATACRFIGEGKRFTMKRLSTILQNSTSVISPEQNLNDIYLAVLQNSIDGYSESEKQELYETLRLILGTLVILFSSLSATSLPKLLYIDQGNLDQTLADLHSILNIPDERTDPIHLHHPTFRDFFLDKQRCDDPFWVNETEAHRVLAENCVRLMSDNLKTDICDVRAPGIHLSEVDSSRIEHHLPAELRYASRYWTQHLQQSKASIQDNDGIYQFLQKHLLHWVEALSLIGCISDGILGLSILLSIVKVSYPRAVVYKCSC